MKIFFTASYSGKDKHQDTYNQIIKILRRLGCEVLSLEIMKPEDYLSENEAKGLVGEALKERFIRKALKTCSATIFEATVESLSLGIEIGLALAYNKPVLCLSSTRDLSKKTRKIGYNADTYTNFDELEKSINDFIAMVNEQSFRSRLHIVMSSDQKNFLNHFAKSRNMNISEVLRNLVDKERGVQSIDNDY